jgi:hypothetical protein
VRNPVWQAVEKLRLRQTVVRIPTGLLNRPVDPLEKSLSPICPCIRMPPII